MAPKPPVTRNTSIRIGGIVQGVGFRPFIARLARKWGLCGSVRNESGNVVIDAYGAEEALNAFIGDIRKGAPTGSRIESLEIIYSKPATDAALAGFSILESRPGAISGAIPTPDIAVCDKCLKEMNIPGDPRCKNPFISCTACGPRFSILRQLPYDRDTTSMAEFPMCAECSRQYRDEPDRRYHAQTVCCNSCGPVLFYRDQGGANASGEAALSAAIDRLKSGGIVAIKGIGGYHLACDPYSAQTVQRLRALKGREAKPFAVLFPSLEAIRRHCSVNEEEEALLLSPARPIVLLLRNAACSISESVYGGSRYMGAFLPYTPLQHLLLNATGELVMTSANASSLPIIKDDGEMNLFFEDHGDLAGVLTHNREIVRRLDDSVTAVTAAGVQLLRRARGYVPLPVAARMPDGPALLAAGAHLKNTVCLCAGKYLYPSTEIGDLENRESIAVYRDTIPDFREILNIRPEAAACDLHPDYESTKLALGSGLPVFRVQHHFAHIASVMAEHGLTGKVIGVAFDGTGYGTDGTVWGGEFLIASPAGFERAGHLKPVGLLKSDDSIRQGWKSAACMLLTANVPPNTEDARVKLVEAALRTGINTVLSSSMGRVFDAASSILGICHESDYEGQGAVELESAAARFATNGERQPEPLPYTIEKHGEALQADLFLCLATLWREKGIGTSAELLAWRFHRTIGRMIVDMCRRLRELHALDAVALSGGVFQNRLLLSMAVPELKEAGFTVYTNHQVPPNDGGLSLGQAYAARFMAQGVQ